MQTDTVQLEDKKIATAKETPYEIVLWNDDVNTFDFVIDCLIEICDHSLEQAEQCTLLVHFKGKCVVKTGSFEDLKPRCTKLLEKGLSAVITLQ